MVDVQKSFKNLLFLHVSLASAHANQSKHATWNAFKIHQNSYPKSSVFPSKLTSFSIIFGIDFQVRLDFGFDFGTCWGPKRRPNGIKASSRKKMPTWAQHKPQHDPKRPPKTASWIGVVVVPRSRIRFLTALMPNKPSWTPFRHHVGQFLKRCWSILGPSSS